jgi:hypothetical protein
MTRQFAGCGIFFNQMYDLSRFQDISGHIDMVIPIMAPDQSAVQHNRSHYKEWREALPNAAFCPWIVCDDPVEDYERAKYVVENYESDGIVMNCEKPYESGGKWKGRVLCDLMMNDPKLGALPKLFSFPSTPAERYDMDYRAFQRAGFRFAPQAYFNEIPDATPKALFDSTVRPLQVHVGRDYRIKIGKTTTIHWSRCVSWNEGSTEAIIKDINANRLYRLPVLPMEEGNYKYMHVDGRRRFYDYKTGKIDCGMLLGFQDKDKVFPTVASYDNYTVLPLEMRTKLEAIPALKGSSLYLGETSTSDHVKAVWEAIQ